MCSVVKKQMLFLRILSFKHLEHALWRPTWPYIGGRRFYNVPMRGGFLGGCVGPLLKVQDRISCPLWNSERFFALFGTLYGVTFTCMECLGFIAPWDVTWMSRNVRCWEWHLFEPARTPFPKVFAKMKAWASRIHTWNELTCSPHGVASWGGKQGHL